jgi:hypothetical protein
MIYRNKINDRIQDINNMQNIINHLINKNNKNIDFKYRYGINDNYVDVKDIVLSKFVKDNEINISKNIIFNDIFGDPVYGQYKKLEINIDKGTTIIDEHRTYDVSIKLN